MNDERYNVFVSVNAISAGSRSRTRDAIGAVRHVFLDADHDGAAVLARGEGAQGLAAPELRSSLVSESCASLLASRTVRLRVGGAPAEAPGLRVGHRPGSDACDANHSPAGVLQPQTRRAASRDGRLSGRQDSLRTPRLSAAGGATLLEAIAASSQRSRSTVQASTGRSGTSPQCRRRSPGSTATFTHFVCAVGSSVDSL
jgi:hypothetical protein